MVKDKLIQFKGPIVFIGLGVGLGLALGFLPDSFAFLEENVKFLYLALILLASYTFWAFYFSMDTTPNIRRTVNSRRLSTPSYQRELRRQRGEYPEPRVPVPEREREPQRRRESPRDSINRDVWNTFDRE